MSLKATWPQILKTEQEYAKIVYHQLRCEELGEDIWRCNLYKKDIVKMKSKSDFWKDVLVAWNKYNICEGRKVENQLIWYNSEIRIQDKPFFWRDMYRNGLKYIYQLYEGKNFKPYERVHTEFGLSFLRYNSLKTAIPQKRKLYFQENEPELYHPISPHNYDQCIQIYLKGFSARVYRSMSDNILLSHYKYVKWRQEIGEDFCEDIFDFGKKHMDLYRVTNIPKYRSFQYRLLQRGLVTNIQLLKWNMVESDACTFCKENRETLMHLLYECREVLPIWESIKEYVQEYYGTEITLSASNVLLNSVCEQRGHVSNFICLMTKQYIYAQRCLKEPIMFQKLLKLIRSVQSVEKYIALKNGHSEKYKKKWYDPQSDSQTPRVEYGI